MNRAKLNAADAHLAQATYRVPPASRRSLE